MSSNALSPQRRVLVVSITLLLLGATLLTLRSTLFSLALMLVGLTLFAYWLYGIVRSRELDRHPLEDDLSSSKSGVGAETICTYSNCKHTESKKCIGTRCVCCVLMRNRQIIGHFNKPLQ